MHMSKCLVDALCHLHCHDLVHTDLKPANIMINGFGLSRTPEPDNGVTRDVFAWRLLHYPEQLHTCLSDSAVMRPGEPNLRVLEARRTGDDDLQHSLVYVFRASPV